MATLVRPRQGKIIAGVCAGLARRFGISVTLIRVAFVVFAVTGIGELVYVIQLGVRTKHGVQEEAVVSGIIKDGLRRLGGT